MRIKYKNIEEIPLKDLKKIYRLTKPEELTNGLKSKANRYLKYSKILEIEAVYYNGELISIEFIWSPIENYNNAFRIVRIYKDKVFCNCDGFKHNKYCSHILALNWLIKNKIKEIWKS